MPSRKKSRDNGEEIELSAEELFKSLQETRDKEIANFGTSVVMLEQRYAHFISSLLDVKKRVCMEVFNNKLKLISDICDKQLTLMNQYYQQEIQQLKSEKKQLIRKNHQHQKLIQKYQTQEIQNKKRKKKKNHKKCKKKQTSDSDHDAENPITIANNINNNNNNKSVDDEPNDVITDIIMNDNCQQITSPFVIHGSDSASPNSANTNNYNDTPDANINFHAMPTFTIEESTPTISKINSTSLTNNNTSSNDDVDSDIIDIGLSDNADMKHKIKKDPSHRKKKKKKRRNKHKKRHRHRSVKKEKYKYKYHKLNDELFVAPARHGDTDKTWLFCNHPRACGSGICGVKFIRTLKDRQDQAQHKCDGDPVQKLITRKFCSVFSKCTYCDGEEPVPCTRLATIDEIAEFQKKLKALNIVPNTYGGYKKRGAKQTISQLTTTPRKRSRKKGRSRARSRSSKSKKKYARKTLASLSPPPRSFMQTDGVGERAKSLGIASVLPRLSDDEVTATIWDDDDDDITTASDINMENKPLQRVSRKRKRREFESDDISSLSDNFVEQELKKQKLDRSELCKLELDELLVKAFSLVPDFDRIWNVHGQWCRYCGAKASLKFLNSPWGENKLCQKHGSLWAQNELDLKQVVEATDMDSVPNKADCTEMEFLIDIIDKHQKMQFKAAPAITIDGKRRSLRNIKKERIALNDDSDSDSEGDYSDAGSYIDSSDESEEDDDDDEPIGDRLMRKDVGNHNGHNGHTMESNIIIDDDNKDNNIMDVINDLNGDFFGLTKKNNNSDCSMNNINDDNKQQSDQSQDEDDDILGVD